MLQPKNFKQWLAQYLWPIQSEEEYSTPKLNDKEAFFPHFLKSVWANTLLKGKSWPLF